MQYNHTIDLDMMRRQSVEIVTHQYDDAGRAVRIRVLADGEPATLPANAQITYSVSKPDGTFCTGACTKEVDGEDTYVVFKLSYQMLILPGRETIDISIRADNASISTMTFINHIMRAAVQADDIESSSEFGQLEIALQGMDEIRDLKEDAEQAVADAQAVVDGIQSDRTQITTNKTDIAQLKEDLTPLYNQKITFSQGYWAVVDGKPTLVNTWCRSRGNLSNTWHIKTKTIKMFLHAFTEDNEYVGTWNGSEFVNVYNSSAYSYDLNIAEWSKKYPEYLFRVSLYNSGKTFTPADCDDDVTLAISIDEIDNAINSLNDSVEYTHAETTDVGSHIYTFPNVIPKNTEITFTNTSLTGAITVNLRDASGNEQNFGSIDAGKSKVIITPFATTAVRNYIGSTDWGIKVTYTGIVKKVADMANILTSVTKADIIPMSNTTVQLTANGFSIETSNKAVYIVFDRNKIAKSFDAIITELGNTYATLDGNILSITMPQEGNLCFDVVNSVFVMHTNMNTIPDGNIVLVWRYYQQYGGYFYERLRSIVNNNDAISRNNSLVTALSKDTFNASYFTGMRNWQETAERFSSLFVDVEDCESFLFFTDPHTQFDPWSAKWEEYMCQLQKMYRSTPCNFVLCGGDWLGMNDTSEKACYRLGVVKATCKTMLDPCYMLVGNHDTNVQSVRLPNYTISNLWYDGKKAYYSFDGVKTKFYCFDTGSETQTLSDLDNYGLNQVLWFATSLTTESASHIALAMHIYYRNHNTETWNEIAHQIMLIASAYNRRSTVTVGTSNFDYTSATGKIEFVLAGHCHADLTYRYQENGCDIPIVITLDTGNSTSFRSDASFDLVFVDYDSRKLYCIRSGVGNDREIVLST